MPVFVLNPTLAELVPEIRSILSKVRRVRWKRTLRTLIHLVRGPALEAKLMGA